MRSYILSGFTFLAFGTFASALPASPGYVAGDVAYPRAVASPGYIAGDVAYPRAVAGPGYVAGDVAYPRAVAGPGYIAGDVAYPRAVTRDQQSIESALNNAVGTLSTIQGNLGESSSLTPSQCLLLRQLLLSQRPDCR